MIRGGLLKGIHMGLDLRHHAQIYLGLYERELHRWLRVLAANAATMIDVGAGEGSYSLYFLTGTSARTVCSIEPDPTALAALRANLRLNRLDADQRLRVYDVRAGSGEGSATMTLDTLFADVELPCVVKVDVEGNEVDVLAGARRLLGRGGVSWIIETHSSELEDQCVRHLTTIGLSVTIVPQAWWRFAVPERRPIPHNRWLIAHERGMRLA